MLIHIRILHLIKIQTVNFVSATEDFIPETKDCGFKNESFIQAKKIPETVKSVSGIPV